MQRILVKIVLFFSITLIVLSCGSGKKAQNSKLSGELSLSGAFALYPLAIKWAHDFQRLYPGVRIDVSAGGAGKGMTDVLAGIVDLGMVSREIYPIEKAKGAFAFPVAIDAIIPIFNSDNPLAEEILKRGITSDDANKIWSTCEYKTLGDLLAIENKTPIRSYTRSDACGAANTWASWFGKSQEDLEGLAVFGDPGIASSIQKDHLSFGYNSIGYIYNASTGKPYKGLLVLPIDINGNGKIDKDEKFYETKNDLIQAISSGKYPSPPARELYFVSKGMPKSKLVREFIKYVLTEGQKENLSAGYINVSKERINKSLSIIEL